MSLPATGGREDSFAERLALLASCSDEIAFIFMDPQGRITHWSRGASTIFGSSAAEMVGRDAAEIFVAEDLERGIDRHERDVAELNDAAEDDRWQKRSDGSRFWATGAMVSLHRDGRHVGFGKVLRNRTDLKAQLEGLRQQVAALEAAGAARDVFLSTLSHELRNPLAPVANALAILRRTPPGAPEHGYALGVIDRQMAVLQRLVDDLLDVTRVGAGKVDIKLAPCVLQEVLASAADSVRPLMAQRGQDFKIILPEGAIVVAADFERLGQVVVNLLNNAAKYTPPSGHVWLTATAEGQEGVIRVEDDGVGIPHEMLPRVFDLFTQVESSRRDSQGGLGIGLSLVKNLVALQGGSVQVRSEGLGKGAEFVVRLPLAPANPPATPR